jgi:hypothetical protein
MQLLDVKGNAYQSPFTGYPFIASQRELPKAQRLFDDTDHRLYRTLPESIDGLADLCLEAISHLDQGSSIIRGRSGLLRREEVLPAFVVWLSSCSNVGFNSEIFLFRRYC